jgi:hypothetical protein
MDRCLLAVLELADKQFVTHLGREDIIARLGVREDPQAYVPAQVQFAADVIVLANHIQHRIDGGVRVYIITVLFPVKGVQVTHVIAVVLLHAEGKQE